MSRRPENGDQNLINRIKSNIGQCFESIDALITNYELIREQKDILIDENESLIEELESLKYEMESLRKEKEIYRSQLIEKSNENELLLAKLCEKDVLHQKAMDFARNMLSGNHVPIELQSNLVNSLPTFSEQMVLKDRPNSITTFGSFSQMKEMRNSFSKENNISSQTTSNQNSRETNTSSDIYFDTTSRPSSLTNASISVRPKQSQQNHILSAVDKKPQNLNKSLLVRNHLSKSNTYDEKNNPKLKLVKVIPYRLTSVSVSYIEMPSSFWLHINEGQVFDYFHMIQIKQKEMESLNNYKLTSADLKPGMYCAANYSANGFWYRAQVVHINYENLIEKDSIKTVKVLFIDWGNIEELPLSKIMKLSNELTQRKQAIHCYLQGIASENTKWPKKSIEEFKEAVDKQKLSANFYNPHKVDEELDWFIYPVDLIVTFRNGETDNIANFLTKPEFSYDEDVDKLEGETKFLTPKSRICEQQTNIKETKLKNSDNQKTSRKQEEKEFNDDINCRPPVMTNSKSKKVPPKVIQCFPHFSEKTINYSLKIPSPIIPDSNEGLIVSISHINNPSEFFVHINDNQVGITQLDDIDEKLTNYCSNHKSEHETQVSQVSIDSFWASQYTQDNQWYRCRVVQIFDSKALVSYVDYGNEELIEIKDLMPLTPTFTTYPALAVKCSLSGIKPVGGEWSEQSIERFIELTGFEEEKLLTAYIGHKPSNFGFDSKLELFLWNNDSNCPTARDILINSKLVVHKLAIADNYEWVEEAERSYRESTPPKVTSKIISKMTDKKSSVNRSSVLKVQMNVRNGTDFSVDNSDDDDWDPMEEYFCDANKDFENPTITALGFRLQDRRRSSGTRGDFRKNEFRRLLHVNLEQRLSAFDLGLEVGSTYFLKVTGIQSPHSFFGILPFGKKSLTEFEFKKLSNNELIKDLKECQQLRDICADLKQHYSNTNLKENSVFHGIGCLVAYKDEKSDTYFRGRIVATDHESNTCTIFNLDLGYTSVVGRNLVFKLDKIFTQLPTLAIRCSLFGVEPSNTAIWSEKSIQAFTDWTLNKCFCAHVFSSSFDNKVSIELIDYSNNDKEYISTKLIENKFAQSVKNNVFVNQKDKLSDNYDIYSSDVD